MKPSAWKNILLEATRALALILVVVSVLVAGVAHAHVADLKATNPENPVVAPLHDSAVAVPAHTNAMPSHCSTVASCHSLFLASVPNATFESESESAVSLPLQYWAPPAPVFSLFRPPRRA